VPFDAGAVQGRLELDAAKFLATMKDVEKRLGSVEAEVKKADAGFAGFAGTLGKMVVSLLAVVGAYVSFSTAAHAITSTLSEASDEAARFETTIQRLGVTLATTGGGDAAAAVEGLKEFASEMQEATGASDGLVLQIAQQLTLYGVQRADLEANTEAVLNYANAFGVDATLAARQFGQSLDGTAGRLAETLPGIRALTEEQLRAGDAFKIAGDRLSGFSENFLKTTAGIRQQFQNTTDELQKNLGAVVNPFFDAFTKLGTEGLQVLGQLLVENVGPLTEGFKSLSLAALSFVETLVNNLPSIGGFIVESFIEIEQLIDAWNSGLALTTLGLKGIQILALSIADLLPGVDLGAQIAAATAEFDILDAKVTALVEVQKQTNAEAVKTRDKFKEMSTEVASRLAPALERARATIAAVDVNAVKAKLSFEGLGGAARRGVESIAKGAEEAYNLQAALAASFAEADKLAGATGEVADNLGGAADGASGGGGGGGGGGLGTGGIHSAGSRSLGLGSAEESLQTLRTESGLLQQAVAGGAYQFQIQGQKNIVENVAAIAQAQVNRAFADYTAEIVRELNGAGIYDETQRSSTIKSRLDEAQRLGILPPRNAVNQIAPALTRRV